MPYLGDYLGFLLAEITDARMQADLESLRLAEIYAGHPLLKHMPIPNFRLPEITLDVPVVIKGMEKAKAGIAARGGVALPVLQKAFREIQRSLLKKHGISLPESGQKRLAESVDEVFTAAGRSLGAGFNVTVLADQLVDATMDSIKISKTEWPAAAPMNPSEFENTMRSAVRNEFAKLRKEPPRLDVLITSSEIASVGTAGSLVQLHMTISEHGYEWTIIEKEGKSTSKLVPE